MGEVSRAIGNIEGRLESALKNPVPDRNRKGIADTPGGPLSGLRVIEVAEGVSGPYCTRLLADAGAMVVKVEPVGGDPSRLEGPFPGDDSDPERSGLFHYLNAGKSGVVADLSGDAGRRTVWQLVRDADVVVANHAPEELQTLGLSIRRLAAVNRRVIFTAITPFGFRSASYRGWKTNDFILWNMGGLGFGTPGLPDYVDDPEAEPPLHPQEPAADIIVGATAAAATLCALHARSQDSKGRLVDIPAQAALAMFNLTDVMPLSYSHILRGRHRVAHGTMPNGLFRSKDGWVVLAAFQGQWPNLIEAMGSPGWANTSRFHTVEGRIAHWDELKTLLQEWALRHPGEEITRLCQSKGLPCFHYQTVPQVLASPHLRERGAFRQLDIQGHQALAPGIPIRLANMYPSLPPRGPRLGQHAQELLHDSGDPAAPGQLYSVERAAPQETARPRLPLDGVRVVDLSQVLAGPFCTQLLAWMGAEVILVENPERPRYRAGPPSDPVNVAAFELVHMNKRSIAVDLKHTEGVALVRDLVRISDVVVDNFKTGVMERLGLGYEEIRQSRPDIVMLSLGAFGRTGPMKHMGGLHSSANLSSGVAATTGYENGRPRILGCQLPDPWSGMYCFIAILMALHQLKVTGQGQYIDASMTEAFMQLVPKAFIDFTLNAREPAFLGNRDRRRVPQGVYRCRGWDSWVAISVSTDEEWKALCGALGKPDLCEDPRFVTVAQRQRYHDEIDATITAWSRRRTPRSAASLLQLAGVPAGPVLNTRDLLNEPHLKARRTIVSVDQLKGGRRRLVGIPWRIGGVAPVRYRYTPAQGQDNYWVLQEMLGRSPDEMQRLDSAGALS